MGEQNPQVLGHSWIFANPGATSTFGSKISQTCSSHPTPELPGASSAAPVGSTGQHKSPRTHPWGVESRAGHRGGREGTGAAFPAGSEGSSLVLQREEQQTHGTAEGAYFWLPIQARIFKYPNSPQRISSLHLVPDLLMKILKKQKKTSSTITQHNPRQPTDSRAAPAQQSWKIHGFHSMATKNPLGRRQS